MSAPNFAIIYPGMSDDEILYVACEASDLREEARETLNGELRKRKLTEKDISAYREHLASIRRGEMAANQKYVARSFLGVGTTIYGKRDFHSDGSYTTAKWATLFWVPIFPLGSVRVGKTAPGSATACPSLSEHYISHFFTWTSKYWVYCKEPLDKKQVLFVYAFVLVLFLTVKRAEHTSPRASLVHLGALCLVPWVLRKMAARPRD